jgi:putative membrane protein
MTETLRKPQAFKLGEPSAMPSSKASRRGRTGSQAAPDITFDEESNDLPAVIAPPLRAPARRLRWGMLFLGSLASLLTIAAGAGFVSLVEELFQRSPILGWIGSACLGLAALAASAVVLRETIGLLRLRRLNSIHDDATRALFGRDADAARLVLRELQALYQGRDDLKWGVEQLAAHARSVVAPEDLMRLAERDIVSILDVPATSLIARAARRVTVLTAVTPAAALDLLFVAAVNLRMLRELAALYGGRPGTLGTLRLARMVIAHLAVTGGLALGDNVLQHVLGRGVLGRLSARFGEGAMNGIMTARIGLAALDLCRPLPFLTETKPSLAMFMRELVSVGRSRRTEDATDASDAAS